MRSMRWDLFSVIRGHGHGHVHGHGIFSLATFKEGKGANNSNPFSPIIMGHGHGHGHGLFILHVLFHVRGSVWQYVHTNMKEYYYMK